jgi:hypothetical protein
MFVPYLTLCAVGSIGSIVVSVVFIDLYHDRWVYLGTFIHRMKYQMPLTQFEMSRLIDGSSEAYHSEWEASPQEDLCIVSEKYGST